MVAVDVDCYDICWEYLDNAEQEAYQRIQRLVTERIDMIERQYHWGYYPTIDTLLAELERLRRDVLDAN